MARTLRQPVRNQSAATIQHEEDGRSAGLAQYSRRIALVTYYPSNDLLAPLVVEKIGTANVR